MKHFLVWRVGIAWEEAEGCAVDKHLRSKEEANRPAGRRIVWHNFRIRPASFAVCAGYSNTITSFRWICRQNGRARKEVLINNSKWRGVWIRMPSYLLGDNPHRESVSIERMECCTRLWRTLWEWEQRERESYDFTVFDKDRKFFLRLWSGFYRWSVCHYWMSEPILPQRTDASRPKMS